MVFTTGGIGPTHDDITSECIAAAFGVPWEIHAETFARDGERIWAENFNAARQRMATMPRGAEPIDNDASLAPGFSIGNVHVMAGVNARWNRYRTWGRISPHECDKLPPSDCLEDAEHRL